MKTEMKPFLNTLGVKLFHLAVDLSRQPLRSKQEMTDAIKGLKTRKKMAMSKALLLVAQCRDVCINNRLERDKHVIMNDDRLAVPLSERFAKYKEIRGEHLKVLVRKCLQFRKPSNSSRYTEEITLSDNPDDWCCDTRLGSVRTGNYSYTVQKLKLCIPPNWNDSVFSALNGSIGGQGYASERHFVVALTLIGETCTNGLFEQHYKCVWGRAGRGLSIKTGRGYMVSAHRAGHTWVNNAVPNRDWRSHAFGHTLEQCRRKILLEDPVRIEAAKEKKKARHAKLQEALVMLEMVQGGRKSIGNMTEAQKANLMKAVQHTLEQKKKLTENFGGIGRRAIHEVNIDATAERENTFFQ